MFIRLLLAAALAGAAPSQLSPQTQALIAPVHDAIAKAQAELAALPPPKDDVDKLLRMRQLEQAPRSAVSRIDFSKIPQVERRAARMAINDQIRPIDEANQKVLLTMVPPEGWFTISKYGRDGSEAAFLIIQHSNPDLWRRFLPVLEPLADKGEVKGGDFALMFDRLAMIEHRAQRYGSQMVCEDGKFVPYTIEDLDHIDARRASLKMTPYKDYLALFADDPPC